MAQVDVAFKKKKSFTNVANAAIRDDKLSPEAKGVYAIIQSWITFEAEDFVCSKSFIFKKSNCGEKKFDRIWNELKQAGYLKMYCVGKANWTAELLDDPKPDEAHTFYLNNEGAVTYTNVDIAEKKAANRAAAEGTEDPEGEEEGEPVRNPQKGGTLEKDLRNPQKRGTLERSTLERGILEQGNNINTPNKNSLNNYSFNNQSIYHSENSANGVDNAPKVKIDRLIDRELIEDIKDQIEYDIMKERFDSELLDTAVSCIAALYTASEPQEFSGATYAPEFIHRRSLEINSGHIEYVFECFEQQRDKVFNIPKYLRAAIFNAPDTISAYYTNAVRADGAVW